MSTVYVNEIPAVRAKFDKIAKRAADKGFEGGLTLEVGEPYEITEGGPYPFPTYQSTVVDVEVSGQPPKFAGWSIIGRVDALPNGSFVVVNAPGVDETIDSSGYTLGTCDHCSINRYRKNTYVVRHEDGTEKFVGSTCLKDFLGWDASPYLVFRDKVNEDDMIGSIDFDPTESLVEAVTWAILSIEDSGYVRSGQIGATKDDVLAVLLNTTRADRERRDELAGIFGDKFDELAPRAQQVVDFIRSDEFAGTSSYVTSLKAIFEAERFPRHLLGYVVSAPQAYRRYLEGEAERTARLKAKEEREAAEAERRASAENVPAGKQTVEGTVVTVKEQQNDFSYYGGMVYKMVVLDDRGFKIWSTIPRAILDTDPSEPLEGLIGKRVRYTATLEASRDDALFGFGKGPSKASVLD